jgi:hypothetical protein
LRVIEAQRRVGQAKTCPLAGLGERHATGTKGMSTELLASDFFGKEVRYIVVSYKCIGIVHCCFPDTRYEWIDCSVLDTHIAVAVAEWILL